MTIESGPPPQKTKDEVVERKDYDLERLSYGGKALAALNVGAIYYLKEKLFANEQKWTFREKEAGSRKMWNLKTFAEKSFLGYQGIEKIEHVMDERRFQEIVIEYEERVNAAATAEERSVLVEEFGEVKRSRDKKLDKENRDKKVCDSFFAIFADIIKK